MYDYLIVGAGFAGCVLAERLASQLNKRVLIVEKRNHIGGNSYDYYDEHGVLVHKYGSHVFHTNSARVFGYLSQFTEWRAYEHHVLSSVDGMKVPIPINMNTLNQLYGMDFKNPREVEEYLNSVKENIPNPKNSEEEVLNKVGKDLYEKFFKNYTRKHWGIPPEKLDSFVTGRIPVRNNRDDRYFTDKYQVMPRNGYSNMFWRMLSHPNISILLNTDFKSLDDSISYDNLILTGAIDDYLDYKFGVLPYRSLRFTFEHHEKEYFQGAGTINYPNEYDFTRICEFKHSTGQKCSGTTIAYIYPVDDNYTDEKYYPIPCQENYALYKRYLSEIEGDKKITLCGRLAEYRYYNMDQVVERALEVFDKVKQELAVAK